MTSEYPRRFSVGDSVRMKDPSVAPPHSGMEMLYEITMTVVECQDMPRERVEEQLASHGRVIQTSIFA